MDIKYIDLDQVNLEEYNQIGYKVFHQTPEGKLMTLNRDNHFNISMVNEGEVMHFFDSEEQAKEYIKFIYRIINGVPRKEFNYIIRKIKYKLEDREIREYYCDLNKPAKEVMRDLEKHIKNKSCVSAKSIIIME